jgi:hypothetical protein
VRFDLVCPGGALRRDLRGLRRARGPRVRSQLLLFRAISETHRDRRPAALVASLESRSAEDRNRRLRCARGWAVSGRPRRRSPSLPTNAKARAALCNRGCLRQVCAREQVRSACTRSLAASGATGARAQRVSLRVHWDDGAAPLHTWPSATNSAFGNAWQGAASEPDPRRAVQATGGGPRRKWNRFYRSSVVT